MQSSASAEAPAGAPATYEVVHTTEYAYSESVSVSHHLARVAPRIFERQDCPVHELVIDPEPAAVRSYHDYFGNAVTLFIMERAHTELTVRARSTVTVRPRTLPDFAMTPPWEAACD